MPRATFKTPLGVCAIAWSDNGLLTHFDLPEAITRSDDVAAPPVEIAAIIERVRRHLAGDLQVFSVLRYDFSAVPPFNHRVCRAPPDVKAGQMSPSGQIPRATEEAPVASR